MTSRFFRKKQTNKSRKTTTKQPIYRRRYQILLQEIGGVVPLIGALGMSAGVKIYLKLIFD